MTDRIVRDFNTQGRYEDGFRILQGKQEYVTYPDESSFRVWYSDIPWQYETHYHSAVEIVLTLSGEVRYEADGRNWTVGENEVILIPPGMPHALSMGPDSKRLLFLFEPDAIFNMRDIKTYMSTFSQVFLLNDGSDLQTGVRDLLNRAWDAFREQDPLWNTECYGCMMLIYTLLGKRYLSTAAPRRQSESTGMDADIITGVMTYINNHYKEDVTLDEVADFAGFSRYYFSRTFKQRTGYSFKEYLCQKRIQVAMDLLTHSQIPMRDVARESGFGSVATFNRVFREIRNCTPTQYRAIYGDY